MSKKLVNIHIEPVVYLKDTNDDYILDSNGDKIVVRQGTSVNPSDDYKYITIITEY